MIDSPDCFLYTDDQRATIANELGGETAATIESIDAVEVLVRQAAHQLEYFAKHPVPDWLADKFRGLEKHIQPIVSVLNNPDSEPLRKVLPHLTRELMLLRQMVRADQRKGPGKPPTPQNVTLGWLVERLAIIWNDHNGAWPKRHYQQEHSRDWGPFYRYLKACLGPAGLSVSDFVIRKVIEAGHPGFGKSP